jgi:DNA-binding transcriptional LysR family regulator
VVISSAASPQLASGRSVTLADVARLPQIVFSSTYDLRAATDATFDAAGLTPAVVLEGAEMDAVLRFVERGLGVAIVPAMVLIDRPGLRSVRLREPKLTRTINVARPVDVEPSSAVGVMQRTIADTTLALARRAGPTMRLAGDPHTAG